MSATCTFCGGNLAPGVLHDPTKCVPTPALDRLDFEATFNALMVANGYDKQNAEWLTSAVLPYLNAQLAERVAEARREEREKFLAVWEVAREEFIQAEIGICKVAERTAHKNDERDLHTEARGIRFAIDKMREALKEAR